MPIAPVGTTPFIPPSIGSSGAAGGAATRAAQESGASAFAQKLDQVSSLTTQADSLATGVATGNLEDVHRFTAAASKAQLGVELTVALRNKAVEAYQEIMRMQV